MPINVANAAFKWKNHLLVDCAHNPFIYFHQIWSINFAIFHIWSELFTGESCSVVTSDWNLWFSIWYTSWKSRIFDWSHFVLWKIDGKLWVEPRYLANGILSMWPKNSFSWRTNHKICALIFALNLFSPCILIGCFQTGFIPSHLKWVAKRPMPNTQLK